MVSDRGLPDRPFTDGERDVYQNSLISDSGLGRFGEGRCRDQIARRGIDRCCDDAQIPSSCFDKSS